MNRYFLAGAAALALAIPAAAQDMAVTSDGDVYVLTDAQQVLYDKWPPERRVSYDAWPMTYREYYWTLTPEQQSGWWVLTDEQRAKVYAMTPPQRAQAWASITSQIAGGTPSTSASATAQTATTAAASASTSGPRFVSNEVVQTLPAADRAATTYPPCKGDGDDRCVNPREAGLNYGDVPLKYWPGKPASEIAGQLPENKPGG
jgi:hypothetical protein